MAKDKIWADNGFALTKTKAIMDLWAYIDHVGIKIMDYAPRAVLGIVIVYFGFKVVNKGIQWLDGLMQRNRFDADLRPFLASLSSVLLKILLLLTAAEVMGVETTSFVAMLAAAGFAVGLALQGSLSNFAGGILILVFKPFKTGDMIRAQDYTGIVNEIQIFNTIIVTLNNRRIVIPNSLLSNGVIENITGAGVIRVDMRFRISLKADIDEVRRTLLQVISDCPYAWTDKVLKTGRQHKVLVHEITENSVDFMIWLWAEGQNYWDVYYHIQEAVKKALDAQGIEIPHPQRDVYIRSEQDWSRPVRQIEE